MDVTAQWADLACYVYFDSHRGPVLAAQSPVMLSGDDAFRLASSLIPEAQLADKAQLIWYSITFTTGAGRILRGGAAYVQRTSQLAERGHVQAAIAFFSDFPSGDYLCRVSAAAIQSVFPFIDPDGSPKPQLQPWLADLMAAVNRRGPSIHSLIAEQVDEMELGSESENETLSRLSPPRLPCVLLRVSQTTVQKLLNEAGYPEQPELKPFVQLLEKNFVPSSIGVASSQALSTRQMIALRCVGCSANLDCEPIASLVDSSPEWADKCELSQPPLRGLSALGPEYARTLPVLLQAVLLGERICVYGQSPRAVSAVVAAISTLTTPFPFCGFQQSMVGASDPWVDTLLFNRDDDRGSPVLRAAMERGGVLIGTVDMQIKAAAERSAIWHVVNVSEAGSLVRSHISTQLPPPLFDTAASDALGKLARVLDPTGRVCDILARVWQISMVAAALQPLAPFFPSVHLSSGIARARGMVAHPDSSNMHQSPVIAQLRGVFQRKREKKQQLSHENPFLMNVDPCPITPLSKDEIRAYSARWRRQVGGLFASQKSMSLFYSLLYGSLFFESVGLARTQLLESAHIVTWLATIPAAPRPPQKILCPTDAPAAQNTIAQRTAATRNPTNTIHRNTLLVEAVAELTQLGQSLCQLLLAVRAASEYHIPASQALSYIDESQNPELLLCAPPPSLADISMSATHTMRTELPDCDIPSAPESFDAQYSPRMAPSQASYQCSDRPPSVDPAPAFVAEVAPRVVTGSPCAITLAGSAPAVQVLRLPGQRGETWPYFCAFLDSFSLDRIFTVCMGRIVSQFRMLCVASTAELRSALARQILPSISRAADLGIVNAGELDEFRRLAGFQINSS